MCVWCGYHSFLVRRPGRIASFARPHLLILLIRQLQQQPVASVRLALPRGRQRGHAWLHGWEHGQVEREAVPLHDGRETLLRDNARAVDATRATLVGVEVAAKGKVVDDVLQGLGRPREIADLGGGLRRIHDAESRTPGGEHARGTAPQASGNRARRQDETPPRARPCG